MYLKVFINLFLIFLLTNSFINFSYADGRRLIVLKSSTTDSLHVRIVKNALKGRPTRIYLGQESLKIKTNVARDFQSEVAKIKLLSGEVLKDIPDNFSGGPLQFAFKKLSRSKRIILSGYFRDGDTSYQIKRDNGLTVLNKIEASSLPSCGHSEIPSRISYLGDENNRILSDQPVEIDVAVFFTPEAINSINGEAYMGVTAAMAVDAANSAYQRSGITHRLRLVHAGPVISNESVNLRADLFRISQKDDGYFDEIHQIRDLVGADLVALMVSQQDAKACGTAYLLRPHLDTTSESFAYSVSAIPCLAFDTFVHEIGHNMGSTHDRENHEHPGFEAFDYSFGYRFFGQDGLEYRTIMAYKPGARISYFSNPLITYAGSSIGSLGADNSKSINNTAPFVASYRQSKVASLLPTPIVATPTAEPDPDPTSTPGVDISMIPSSVFGMKAVANKRGYCIVTGTLFNEMKTAMSGIEVVAVRANNPSKYMSKIKRTTKSGKISLLTKLRSGWKIALFFPATASYTSLIKCRRK